MIPLIFYVLYFFGAWESLKWGIAGTGRIANDFVTALNGLPDHQVIAVAARKLENAKKFADLHKIPNAYEGYLNLTTDKHVDVVFVAVITAYHYEVAKLMLENGKNVLSEKSLTVNSKKTGELIDLAKREKLFLMEGVWSRCFPVYDELRRILDNGELGEIKEVYASFGFNLEELFRVHSKDLKASIMFELGMYPLQLQQFVYRGLKPEKILASGTVNTEGVDRSVDAILVYPEGKRGILSTSNEVDLPPNAIISGTNGTIIIPDFWAPTELIKNGVRQEYPIIKNNGSFIIEKSEGLAYEAEEVRKCIQNGKLESSKIPHSETLYMAEIMDQLREQIGALAYS